MKKIKRDRNKKAAVSKVVYQINPRYLRAIKDERNTFETATVNFI